MARPSSTEYQTLANVKIVSVAEENGDIRDCVISSNNSSSSSSTANTNSSSSKRAFMSRCFIVRTSRLEPLLLFMALVLLCIYAIISSLSSQELSQAEKQIYEDTLRVCDNRTVRGVEDKWPKIIHQTWKNHDVPEKFRKFMKSCQDMNPDYEYMFWTDADIQSHIDTHYPWFKSVYSKYPYKIQKIDSGRLFIMHYYGGVYIDIDIECKVPLDIITEQANKDRQEPADIILARTDPIGITNNILMGKAKHPFYNFLIHRLPVTFGTRFTPHWTVMLSAGPLFLYRSYLIYPCKSHIKLISTEDHSKKYFHHVQARTWHSWDGPFITWFDYHGRTLLKAVGVLLVLFAITCVVYRYRRYCAQRFKRTHSRWPSDASDSWKFMPEISPDKSMNKFGN